MDLLPLDCGPLAFVMAHRNCSGDAERRLLQRVIKCMFEQSDDHWQLYIVDDASTYKPAVDYLEHLQRNCPERIQVQTLKERKGPGVCRNLGIRTAAYNGCPVIMFCDSDDLIHKERVRTTRERFLNSPDPTVLYSGFHALDSNGFKVPDEDLTPSLLEIIQAIQPVPPEGTDTWKTIATETGYLNLTSSTSVSTELAVLQPFPQESVSEDSHTWMRYSAAGATYAYEPDIPVGYRVKQGGISSSREGGVDFYAEKMRVDTDGFTQALNTAWLMGRICDETESAELMARFHLRLASTMKREYRDDLALQAVELAHSADMMVTASEIIYFPELTALLDQVTGLDRAA